MDLQGLDDWKLAHRFLRPMGIEVLSIRPPLPAEYWAEKERRKEEARLEFLHRGYTVTEIAAIERGDWFRVIAARKHRERLNHPRSA